MKINEEIEKSFGDGPAHRPVEERIVAGRRRVRQRRTGIAAGVAATALTIGGVAWAVTPGSSTTVAPEGGLFAAQPSGEPSDKPADKPADQGPGTRDQKDEAEQDPEDYLLKQELATYVGDGELWIRDGWTVAERIPNPFGRHLPDRSVGLALTNGEKTRWYLLDMDRKGIYASSDPAGTGFATLDAWVADQVALQGGAESPTPVEFRAGTPELVAVDGATIVRQRANPDVPGFARPGDTTAVAEVRWDGATYFVLARQTAGADPEYFPTQAAVPAEPTLESFLDHAREQYGSGEGLR